MVRGVVDLRMAAEAELGTAISDEDYLKALPVAERKLAWINSINGTNHGNAYLVILIAEAVRARWLTKYLDAANAALEAKREYRASGGGAPARRPHERR